MGKKLFYFLLISILCLAIIFGLYHLFNKKEEQVDKINFDENTIYNSNIIKEVIYSSRDSKGNEYIIKAAEGEIDYKNSDVIYLTKVTGLIRLKNSENVNISADYGKYNINNYDTIFSKNVIVDYLDNKISSEYLDLSLARNSMIISKNVIYTNLKNILKGDVIEIKVKTKDTLIYMYEENKKINIKSKN